MDNESSGATLLSHTTIDMQDTERFQKSIQVDSHSILVNQICSKFRNSMRALLILNIVLYSFESIVGLSIVPSSQDLILLLVGYFAQDSFRVRTLHLYIRLTWLSIVVDSLGLLTSVIIVLLKIGPHWFMFFLLSLFGVEMFFKASIPGLYMV